MADLLAELVNVARTHARSDSLAPDRPIARAGIELIYHETDPAREQEVWIWQAPEGQGIDLLEDQPSSKFRRPVEEFRVSAVPHGYRGFTPHAGMLMLTWSWADHISQPLTDWPYGPRLPADGMLMGRRQSGADWIIPILGSHASVIATTDGGKTTCLRIGMKNTLAMSPMTMTVYVDLVKHAGAVTDMPEVRAITTADELAEFIGWLQAECAYRYTLATEHTPTPTAPQICVFVDELIRVEEALGQSVFRQVLRETRGAGVTFFLATHRGTKGGIDTETAKSILNRVVLRTASEVEAGYAFDISDRSILKRIKAHELPKREGFGYIKTADDVEPEKCRLWHAPMTDLGSWPTLPVRGPSSKVRATVTPRLVLNARTGTPTPPPPTAAEWLDVGRIVELDAIPTVTAPPAPSDWATMTWKQLILAVLDEAATSGVAVTQQTQVAEMIAAHGRADDPKQISRQISTHMRELVDRGEIERVGTTKPQTYQRKQHPK